MAWMSHPCRMNGLDVAWVWRPAVMSQVYLRSSARGLSPARPGPGPMTCSGVRGCPAAMTSKTHPVSAIRWQPFFSPVPARFQSSVPSAPGTWCGGGAPPGASPRPCRPPRSPAAAGSALPPRPRPGPPSPGPGPVGPLRVGGRGDGDLLQLPLADPHPGRGQHELVRLLIRPGPAEHLRQPLQRPGVPQRRQVQHRIAREQRQHALDPGPVADPPHDHLTQPRHHRPGMTPLSAAPPHPVLAGHLRQPDLALSLAIQAELDHPAQQIPATPGDQPFHRIQRHRPARLPGQPGQLHRQRPQSRQHRLRARRQLIQPVLFHLRLPFRSPGLRNFRTLRNGSLTNTQPRHNRGNSLHKSHIHAASTPYAAGTKWYRAGRKALLFDIEVLSSPTRSCVSRLPRPAADACARVTGTPRIGLE